jgi:hypothetical protein
MPVCDHAHIRYYSMASAAEMCAIQGQDKSGILKKSPQILKKNTALLQRAPAHTVGKAYFASAPGQITTPRWLARKLVEVFVNLKLPFDVHVRVG